MRGSLLVVDAKTPSFAMLTRYLYLSGRNPGAASLVPNEMASQQQAPPPWTALWNSNAYAIRDKCEKKIEIGKNSCEIICL
jgi:hypothetical protein